MNEVREILHAAQQDPFHGYNWDGDQHWTPDLVLRWWDGWEEVDQWLGTETFHDLGEATDEAISRATAFRKYLRTDLRDDLLSYAEWLSNQDA